MPDLYNRTFSRKDLLKRVGHINQIGGIQILSSEDGPSRGVRYLDFRTGTGFNFKVAIERGMDVGYCEYKGESLAWIPPTLLPGPWYFEQQTEFGWLRTALGGFNTSCGMIHIGNPESASVEHYNFPARPEERYGVHDRMAMLPGQLISYGEKWEGDDCLLEAVGKVIQAQAYGENLVLTRRYTSKLGESRFFMHDEIVNAGYLPTEHMLLYHMNIGFPFVDEGSEFIAPFDGPPIVPKGVPAPSTADEYKKFISPQKDWILQGFEFAMHSDVDGRVPVAIVNPNLGKGGRGVFVIYNREQMPRYIEWRMMAEGMYVVGIEPCTNTFGRDLVRELGEQIILEPGDKRTYDIEVGILDGEEQIESFKQQIKMLSK